ncbi:MAG: hypothetical protein LBE91_10370 [Tannerella sp.]|jgi:hypothetical protein|nr:hypothetical protein [Tannerella sp.]
MKVDLNRNFKDIAGTDIPGETMADTVSKGLFMGRGVSVVDANEKYLAYKLSTKLIAGKGETELSDAEVELIRKVAAAICTPGAYGQVVDYLDERVNG